MFSESELMEARKQLASRKAIKEEEWVEVKERRELVICFRSGAKFTKEKFSGILSSKLYPLCVAQGITEVGSAALRELLRSIMIRDCYIDVVGEPEYIGIKVENVKGDRFFTEVNRIFDPIYDAVRSYLSRELRERFSKRKTDSFPRWYGNETTKDHELAVVSEYSSPTVCKPDPGSTSHIFNQITSIPKTATVTRIIKSETTVSDDGEVTVKFYDELVFKNADGKRESIDPRNTYGRDKVRISKFRTAVEKGIKEDAERHAKLVAAMSKLFS